MEIETLDNWTLISKYEEKKMSCGDPLVQISFLHVVTGWLKWASLWAYIEPESFWRLQEWEECGRFYRCLEKSTQLYTMVEDMRGVHNLLENSRGLLYILVHRLIPKMMYDILEYTWVVRNPPRFQIVPLMPHLVKAPSKWVPKALVKVSLSNKKLLFLKSCLLRLLKFPSREHLSLTR